MTAVLLTTLAPLAVSGAPNVAAQVAAFDRGFTLTLALFGAHLALVGWLLVQSRAVPAALGWAVSIGGVAYIVNALTLLAAPSLHQAVKAPLTLLGLSELVLAVWLVARPRTLHLHAG